MKNVYYNFNGLWIVTIKVCKCTNSTGDKSTCIWVKQFYENVQKEVWRAFMKLAIMT